MEEPSSAEICLTIIKGSEPDRKWYVYAVFPSALYVCAYRRTMNFNKFHASIEKAYYASFKAWYENNPKTVGQFLHPVTVNITGPLSTTSLQLSVAIEYSKHASTMEPLRRDYFCCFLADEIDEGKLDYDGEEKKSCCSSRSPPPIGGRWQRTSLNVQVPSRVHVRVFVFHMHSA